MDVARTLASILLAILLAGCPTERSGFERGERPPEPGVAPRAEADSTGLPGLSHPPLLTIDTEPPDDAVSGALTVALRVSDPDSTGFAVTIRYGTDGPDGPLAPASLTSQVDFPGVVPEPPLEEFGVNVTWDAASDVHDFCADGVLEFCVEDDGGMSGGCTLWPADGGLVLLPGGGVGGGTGDLCEPGDMEDMAWWGSEAYVPLTDGSCDTFAASDPPDPDDFAARWLLVLINPNDDDASFTISHTEAQAPGPPPPAPPPLARPARSATSPPPGPPPPCDPDLGPEHIGGDARTFYLPESAAPGAPRETRGATLRALGDRVAIYVDDATPIDHDDDCDDPGNPIELDELPAFGFDDCQLQQVADVMDGSLLDGVEALTGQLPDIDCDCRLTVFVSHRLNSMAPTSSIAAEGIGMVRSFAEPQVDFWPADLADNPGSNERDIVYVYAPDPAALWNPRPVPLDEYLGFELLGQLGDAVASLGMYATGVGLEPGCPAALGNPGGQCSGSGPDGMLADWLRDGIGQLAADESGFGAAFHLDAWSYLDRSHLVPLTHSNELDDADNRAGSWLVLRYLHDVHGPGAAWTLLDTGGEAEAVAAVTGQGLDDFLLDWATSLAVTGRTGPDGEPLVDPEVLPAFAEPTEATVADPGAPAPGELWGANGYQVGFDVRGLNVSRSGGDDPAGPVVEAEHVTDNLDRLLYHPQNDFFATISGHHGVAVVLVAGFGQDAHTLHLETEGDLDLAGRVVRLTDEDPHSPGLVLEDVDGPLLTTARTLEPLDWAGAPRHVIGRIDPAETVEVVPSMVLWDDDDDSAGAGSWEEPVPDIDRYLLELPALAHVAVQVERRTSDLEGGWALDDPFVVVTSADAVPDVGNGAHWNLDPGAPCASPDVYAWPVVVPDFVADQGILSTGLAPPPVEPGQGQLHDWGCEYDLDGDRVLDFLEPTPTSLPRQLYSFFRDQTGCDPCDPLIAVDPDSPHGGGLTTTWTELGLGGQAQPEGSEAAWHGWLPPGEWMLLVGATSGAGPYELTVRRIP